MFNKERDQDRYLEARKWGRKAYPWAHRVIAAIEVILPPVTGVYIETYVLAILYLLLRDDGMPILRWLELVAGALISFAFMTLFAQGCWLALCSHFSYFFCYRRSHLCGLSIGAGLTLAFVAGFWMLGYLREILTLFLVCSTALYGVISLVIIAWMSMLIVMSLTRPTE